MEVRSDSPITQPGMEAVGGTREQSNSGKVQEQGGEDKGRIDPAKSDSPMATSFISKKTTKQAKAVLLTLGFATVGLLGGPVGSLIGICLAVHKFAKWDWGKFDKKPESKTEPEPQNQVKDRSAPTEAKQLTRAELMELGKQNRYVPPKK